MADGICGVSPAWSWMGTVFSGFLSSSTGEDPGIFLQQYMALTRFWHSLESMRIRGTLRSFSASSRRHSR